MLLLSTYLSFSLILSHSISLSIFTFIFSFLYSVVRDIFLLFCHCVFYFTQNQFRWQFIIHPWFTYMNISISKHPNRSSGSFKTDIRIDCIMFQSCNLWILNIFFYVAYYFAVLHCPISVRVVCIDRVVCMVCNAPPRCDQKLKTKRESISTVSFRQNQQHIVRAVRGWLKIYSTLDSLSSSSKCFLRLCFALLSHDFHGGRATGPPSHN